MATYYVDTASVGGNGTTTATSGANAAWKTLSAISGIAAGDSILLKKGCTWRESFDSSVSGSSGSSITLGSYGTGADPIICGADLVTDWTVYSGNIWQAACSDPAYAMGYGYGPIFIDNNVGDHKTSTGELVNQYDYYWASNILYLYAASDPDALYTAPGVEVRVRQAVLTFDNEYWIVDGLVVEKGCDWGISMVTGSSHIVVKNSTMQYCGWGLALSGSTLVTDFDFYDNVFRWNNIQGIGAIRGVTDVRIHNNQIYANSTVLPGEGNGAGIKFWDEPQESPEMPRVEKIEVYENYIHDHPVGIWFDTLQPTTYPNLIHHNWIDDAPGLGVFIEITSDTHAWSNVIVNCGTDVAGQAWNKAGIAISGRLNWNSDDNLIYNNTVYGGALGLSCWLDAYNLTTATINNNIFKNNIVYGYTTRALSAGRGGDNVTYGSGNVYEYNCFGPESSNFIEWGAGVYKSTYDAWESTYGDSTHSVEADPQMHDPDNGDFTLDSDSPCIDAGTDLGTTYQQGLGDASVWPDAVVLVDQETHATS